MRYFTRIQLDSRNPQAREAVAAASVTDVYAEHQWLWHFFPAPPGSPRDFLFRRVEPQGMDLQPTYYAVSARPAQRPHPAWIVQEREYRPRLRPHQQLRFELRTNPVRARYLAREGDMADAYHQARRDAGRKPAEGVTRRKEYDDVVWLAKREIMQQHGVDKLAAVPPEHRPPLYDLVHQAVSGWFCGSEHEPGIAARHGFRVVADTLRVDAYRQHRLPRKGSAPIQFSTVDLSGVLEVEDAAAASDALLNGIGRARGFGCGLLLVRPV